MQKLEIKTRKGNRTPVYNWNVSESTIFLKDGSDRIECNAGDTVYIHIYQEGKQVFSGDKAEFFEQVNTAQAKEKKTEFLEVYFEMVQHIVLEEDTEGSEANFIAFTQGIGGKYELAEQMATEFCNQNKGIIWGIDAEYFDVLEKYLENRKEKFEATQTVKK